MFASGVPATSPNRKLNPNAIEKRNRQTNSWLASGKNVVGCVMATSAGASERAISPISGFANPIVIMNATSGQTRNSTTPITIGAAQITDSSATRTVNAMPMAADALRASNPVDASPMTSIVPARPIANRHDDRIRSAAFPAASAGSSKTEPTIRHAAVTPSAVRSRCIDCGLNAASKPTVSMNTAYAVTEMSRANVNTGSNSGNTTWFMSDTENIMRASAAVTRQNTASNTAPAAWFFSSPIAIRPRNPNGSNRKYYQKRR